LRLVLRHIRVVLWSNAGATTGTGAAASRALDTLHSPIAPITAPLVLRGRGAPLASDGASPGAESTSTAALQAGAGGLVAAAGTMCVNDDIVFCCCVHVILCFCACEFVCVCVCVCVCVIYVMRGLERKCVRAYARALMGVLD
jgi:hypothetical protein